MGDFTYLGSLMSSSVVDIKKTIALAWAASNNMTKIWKSSISKTVRLRLFRATVESVLLYGSEAWTLTDTTTKRLDGAYTRLLRTALGVSWKDRVKKRNALWQSA